MILNERPHDFITLAYERQQSEWHSIAKALQHSYECEFRERQRHQNEKNELSRRLAEYEDRYGQIDGSKITCKCGNTYTPRLGFAQCPECGA